jgi:hypothetical protein
MARPNNCEGTPANVLPPRYNHAQTADPLRMIYYAHTAEDPEGNSLPGQAKKVRF